MNNATLDQFDALLATLGNSSVARGMVAMKRRLSIEQNNDYDAFVAMLYEDLDPCIHSMQSAPQIRQNDGEDRLTEDLILQLRKLGYGVSHDNAAGGHVDITVSLGELTWIGEAKKDQKFFAGYQQLGTRYRPASGNPKHNAYGLIFFLIKHSDAAGKLKQWREELQASAPADYSDRDCNSNPFAFYSTEKADWSGMPIHIRHMVVGLYHNPQDPAGVAKKQRSAAKAAASTAKATSQKT